MLGLDDLEIGLMFWASDDPAKDIRHVKEFGLRAGQLGFPGDLPLIGQAETWDRVLTDERFTVVTAVCSYSGESYQSFEQVENTVGLVPAKTRYARVHRTKEVSNLAKTLAIDSIACHIGFIPTDSGTVLYREIRDITREISDHCSSNGQNFALETGQEPAQVLLRFIEDVGRDNLKVNFDPANMILYGTGDPLEALSVLAPYVVSVHCKDGDWPDRSNPNALGEEKPLGEGSVGIDRFVHHLKELGYRGILSIEREEPNTEKRDRDVADAIKLLRWLTGRD